jgi:hypothetical protein
MNWASRRENIAILEWWKKSGLKCKWTKNATNYATENNHVAVLQW